MTDERETLTDGRVYLNNGRCWMCGRRTLRAKFSDLLRQLLAAIGA